MDIGFYSVHEYSGTMRLFMPKVASLLVASSIFAVEYNVSGFSPTALMAVRNYRLTSVSTGTYHQRYRQQQHTSMPLSASAANDEESDAENPYADPNYPDLEFVNYDDPEYRVDQGEEIFDEVKSTEDEIEEMREDRRRRNDEFQFQTYYRDVLREGSKFYGEWTIYRTSTFLNDPSIDLVDKNGMPRIKQHPETVYVVSTSNKEVVETESDMPVDGERIIATSRLATQEEVDNPLLKSLDSSEETQAIVGARYAPERLEPRDFRGPQGNMIVGHAYTTTYGVTADGKDKDFQEYRTEVGLWYESMRFRLLLDYRVADIDSDRTNLQLYSVVLGRETLDGFPRTRKVENSQDQNVLDALFGTPGAPGGLYDPPPVGGEEQAVKYMLLPFEGRASVLVPHTLHQDQLFDDDGWVMTLDWTPGSQRYQVDRKIQAAPSLMGLRTLELSEVQASNVDDWRPSDDGEDMRQ